MMLTKKSRIHQLLIYRDKLDEAVKTIGHNPNLGHGSPELPETHRLD